MYFSPPHIMGILNLTPDSFSDGGRFNQMDAAIKRIEEMIGQGAQIIDVGGESTGPGSKNISAEAELLRVKPLIDLVFKNGLAKKVFFSIDTYKASVAEYALAHGFQVLNDVTAMRGDPDMAGVILKYQPYVVLMYSKDSTARTTKDVVEYDDVMVTIKSFLLERAQMLIANGFPKEKIILDPGMGAFISGNPKYSFEVIARLPELTAFGYPILIGISRKSCLGGKLEERDGPSVEWSIRAVKNGAAIIRIHDVVGMKGALSVV